MSAPIKRGLEKKIHHFQGKRLPDYPTPHDEYIGIIVLSAEASGKKVVAQGSPHSLIPVCHKTHSDSCSTNEYSAFEFSVCNGLGDQMADFRIVKGIEIENSRIAEPQKSLCFSDALCILLSAQNRRGRSR